MKILIEISPGELFDRITILEIKRQRIDDPVKSHNIATELAMLRITEIQAIMPDPLCHDPVLSAEVNRLRKTNERIFDAIDEQWRFHKVGFHGEPFAIASAYVLEQNAVRAEIKRRINDLHGYTVQEEKSNDLGI